MQVEKAIQSQDLHLRIPKCKFTIFRFEAYQQRCAAPHETPPSPSPTVSLPNRDASDANEIDTIRTM